MSSFKIKENQKEIHIKISSVILRLSVYEIENKPYQIIWKTKTSFEQKSNVTSPTENMELSTL